MNKFSFLEQLGVIINSLVISIVASFVRLMLHKNGSFIQACLVFFGGTLFGTFVGYLIDGVAVLEPFSKVIVAASALTGKEVVESVITYVPLLVRKIIIKKTTVEDDTTDNK